MFEQQDDILAKIVALAQSDASVAAVWLYGSRAEGRSRAESDYDIAVAFQKSLANDADRCLRPQLLASEWRRKTGLAEPHLSIVDINRVPIPLAVNIIEANRLLFSRDDLRVVREQNRIWGLWSDILWHQSARQPNLP